MEGDGQTQNTASIQIKVYSGRRWTDTEHNKSTDRGLQWKETDRHRTLTAGPSRPLSPGVPSRPWEEQEIDRTNEIHKKTTT